MMGQWAMTYDDMTHPAVILDMLVHRGLEDFNGHHHSLHVHRPHFQGCRHLVLLLDHDSETTTLLVQFSKGSISGSRG
jgi:hypothetical protein